jgi:hypothetical protein
MDALRPFAKRLRYSVHYKRPEATEPIFALFLTERDASDAMRKVSEHTKVPISTLYSWREKVRADCDYRPSHEYLSSDATAFPPEVEALVEYHSKKASHKQLLRIAGKTGYILQNVPQVICECRRP